MSSGNSRRAGAAGQLPARGGWGGGGSVGRVVARGQSRQHFLGHDKEATSRLDGGCGRVSGRKTRPSPLLFKDDFFLR